MKIPSFILSNKQPYYIIHTTLLMLHWCIFRCIKTILQNITPFIIFNIFQYQPSIIFIFHNNNIQSLNAFYSVEAQFFKPIKCNLKIYKWFPYDVEMISLQSPIISEHYEWYRFYQSWYNTCSILWVIDISIKMYIIISKPLSVVCCGRCFILIPKLKLTFWNLIKF